MKLKTSRKSKKSTKDWLKAQQKYQNENYKWETLTKETNPKLQGKYSYATLKNDVVNNK